MNRRRFLEVVAGTAIIGQSARAFAATAPTGPLWRWRAVDLAAGIRAGAISSKDATLSAFERLDAVNPKVNAVVEVLRDEALRAADLADRSVREGGPLGVLHGVPITTKINVDLKGHPTTNGVVAMKDNIAKEDSSSVRNLRQAGGVIIGRTNTPSMSFRWFTDNDLHGATLNPWRRDITPGGSSGGAAVAVAVGIGAIAHGNDIAGSVRYPGYACGVPALRPSLGRAPSAAPAGRGITFALMGVQGVLARNCADLRIGLEALSAEDYRDPFWVPAPLSFPGAASRVKVALYSRPPEFAPAPAVAAALESAAKALMAAGYEVEEKQLPNFAEGGDLWSRLVMNEARGDFADAVVKSGDAKVRKKVLDWLAVTPTADLAQFSAALARRDAIGAAWNALLQEYPVILMPSSWEPPFAVDFDQGGQEVLRRILKAQSPMLLPALLGLPGLSVPTAAPGGIPTGVQIVASRYREDLCLAVGEVIERAHIMPTPIDPRF